MSTTDLQAKCKHCGKPAGHHRSTDKACPMGRKNRVHGYPYYSQDTRFEAKKKDPT